MDNADAALAQLRRGTIEFCVLALLRDEPKYGVEIARRLGDADALVTSEGTIYPLLARLRRAGLVASHLHESPQGAPRRYYELTPAGKKSLQLFVNRWRQFADAVELVLGERS